MELTTNFETKASWDQVMAALTDFSDGRLKIWKDSLDPEKFEVFEVTPTSARVREGSKFPNDWAIENYDYSEAGKVSNASRTAISASRAVAAHTRSQMVPTAGARLNCTGSDNQAISGAGSLSLR